LSRRVLLKQGLLDTRFVPILSLPLWLATNLNIFLHNRLTSSSLPLRQPP